MGLNYMGKSFDGGGLTGVCGVNWGETVFFNERICVNLEIFEFFKKNKKKIKNK